MSDGCDNQHRQSELATSLGEVRSRIAGACKAAGRDRGEVTMIAVTKNCPASDVAVLARLGVLDIGESKEQEARGKLAELGPTEPAGTAGTAGPGSVCADLRWHLIGRLQSNKARSVASFAHAVHSVDRLKLVRGLADGAAEREAPLEVFVQVSLDGDPDRGGAMAQDVARLADTIEQRPQLRLRGVMAVPPIGSDPAEGFARLAEVSSRLQVDHPQASAISAGMSADLEHAITHGSTYVRVGTALLGRRRQSFS